MSRKTEKWSSICYLLREQFENIFLSVIFAFDERKFLPLRTVWILILQAKELYAYCIVMVLRVYIRHFINDIEVKVQSQLLTVKWLIPIEFSIYSTSSP